MLAVAAASGRVGYVFLVNGTLYSWQLSRKAAQGPEDAARLTKSWIDRLHPTVVVTEKITKRCRKGKTVQALIEAIARVAEHEPLFDVSVPRQCRYANKYVEAEALVDRFPELRPRLPKPRKLWDSEPRNTTIFEALALALEVVDREPDTGSQPKR